MFIQDENHNPLKVEEVKKELADLSGVSAPSEEEANTELQELYSMALKKEVNVDVYGSAVGDILRKIKKRVCLVLGTGSTTEDVIEAILGALASVIPGGIILKPLVQKLAKLILKNGVGAFCGTV